MYTDALVLLARYWPWVIFAVLVLLAVHLGRVLRWRLRLQRLTVRDAVWAQSGWFTTYDAWTFAEDTWPKTAPSLALTMDELGRMAAEGNVVCVMGPVRAGDLRQRRWYRVWREGDGSLTRPG